MSEDGSEEEDQALVVDDAKAGDVARPRLGQKDARHPNLKDIVVQSKRLCALLTEEETRLNKEWMSLQSERKAYEDMKAKVKKVTFKSAVKLDVGGQIFKTSLLTLQMVPTSMLGAMFSGSGFCMEPEEDGTYFIDRDGTHFRHILNFLRSSLDVSLIPKNIRREVANEAKFYQLSEMAELLDPQEIECTFQNITLKTGVMHWIGTIEGEMDYTNPHQMVSAVSTFGPDPSLLFSEGKDAGSCTNATGKYFTIDLKKYSLRPNYYSFSWLKSSHIEKRDYGELSLLYSEPSRSSCKPGTWMLSGSNQIGNWTPLDIHTVFECTKVIDREFPLACDKSYRCFKFECTGCGKKKRNKSYCFHFCNFELYGQIKKM